MDLKQGTLTIGQLLAHPRAAALLNQIDPRLLHHPMAPLIRGWTVNQAAAFAQRHGASPEQVQLVLQQLEAL